MNSLRRQVSLRSRAWLVGLLVVAAWTGTLGLPAQAATEVHVSSPLPATANDVNRPLAANSPQLVAHPDDARFVAMAHRFDGPDFGCALELSANGGGTWAPVAPVPTLPAGMDKCYAPEVAFDGRGRLVYLFVGLAGGGNVPKGVFLTSSSDGGRHFASPRQVLGPYSFGVRMAVDRRVGSLGRIHLVWLAASGEPPLGGMPAPPNPILATHSDDGGATWSEPVAVSDPARTRVVAPALALSPDGDVHVLYYDLLDDARDYQGLEGPTWEDPWALVMASSGDGGRSFGPGVVVEPKVVPPERVMLIFTMAPAAVAAGDDGELYVAWHDARNRDWDVFLRRSTNGGKSWSAPLRLNDDAVGNGRHQYQPRLGVAPGGRVDAVFYDRRADEANVANHLAYTFSTDGGGRFAPNRMLSSRPSDARIGQSYVGPAAVGLVEFGSRLGLLSLDTRAVAAWTDTANSVREVQQDIFTSTVQLAGGSSDGGGAPTWLWVLVGGVVVLTGGAVAATSRRGPGRKAAQP